MAFGKGLSALVLLLGIGATNAAITKRVACADGVHTATNAACCALFPIVEDIQTNMLDGECGDEAHSALRLIFHDAIAISPTLGGGGADGSIFLFQDQELQDPSNNGIDDALDVESPFITKWSDVISVPDFIQLAGAVSLSNCPGAPRVNFRLGRKNGTAAAPPGLVPDPFDTISDILERFAEVGFSPPEVVAALASHSIAGADDVDPTIPGTPFDSTPSVFDSQLFVEVQLRGTLFPGDGPNQGEVQSAVRGELRLQSDHLLARDSRTSCTWQSFVTNHNSLQQAFGNAVFKISLLGHNENDLIDCSEVIPTPPSLKVTTPMFPPTLSNKDVEQACATSAFPKLATQPGPATAIPAIPQS